jgi:hypothetical protein
MQNDLTTIKRANVTLLSTNNLKLCIEMRNLSSQHFLTPVSIFSFKLAFSHSSYLILTQVSTFSLKSAFSHSRYILNFIDNFSRKIWVYVLKSKSKVLARFK